MMPSDTDQYCIEPGYKARLEPNYFLDTPSRYVYQPDVYARAAEIARNLNVRCIVDVGAGNGFKLSRIGEADRRIALDFGANLEEGPKRYPSLEWRRYDAESDERLPVQDSELQGALIICADVIEHVPHPERLLMALKRALSDGAVAVVLSTPDRERIGGPMDGPPRNPAHVREWTREELVLFVEREGFHCGAAGWTRPHHLSTACTTIELLLTADESTLDELRLDLNGSRRIGNRFADLGENRFKSWLRFTFPLRRRFLFYKDRIDRKSVV